MADLDRRIVVFSGAFVVVLAVVVLVFAPSFFGGRDSSTFHFSSAREFEAEFLGGVFVEGDVVFITDTISGLWYDNSTGYSYLMFESLDDGRSADPGYDAGFPGNIADAYGVGDRVVLEVVLVRDSTISGFSLVGQSQSIERA